MSDQSSSSAPNAASSNGASPGGALAPITPVDRLPMAPFGPDMGNRQDVVRGGMDPASLFHSFRRRWLLAVCMGALVGAASGVALFFLFPESSAAVQLFQVSSKTQEIIGSGLGQETEFGTFKKTQAVLIKSQFVLNRAISAEGVVQTSFFKDVEQGDEWRHLSEELEVNFPQDSEVMRVSLSGSSPTEELKLIIEAVSKAYEDEVLFKYKSERLRPRDILVRSLAKLNKEVLRKSEQLEGILKDKGDGFSNVDGQADPQTRLLTSEALALQRSIAETKQQLITIASEFERQRRMITDQQLVELRIDDAIAGMAETQELEAQVLFLKMQLREVLRNASGRRGQSAAQQLQRQYDTLAAEMDAYKADLKRRMLDEERRNPSPELRLLIQDVQRQTAVLQKQQQQAEARVAEITEILRERGEVTSDLVMRRNEIEGLRSVASTIALRIAQWDVEAEADDRISKIEGIETATGINTVQRYAIAGAGGIACFALTCFGIAYLEFRNRRLNGPEQVDEGLGIRVIGTLPGLSGRKALDPRHPVVAQLTESIDSVRTALMHEATSNRRQIVMVTSAAAMEGRTTVASQLAASLARANRRTLLIDGDLRRPALHNLFDVPLEDGLCEVLRAEADVADVIRPTHAEGLWVITAGYVDADAVHALATDQVQPVFDKLRADYDFIIIDGAPVLGLSDSLLFGQHCDGAILSVLRDHTAVPKIQQSAQLMKSVGIRLIGAVVNGVVSKADRRVTHLQAVAPKSEQKQLEQVEA